MTDGHDTTTGASGGSEPSMMRSAIIAHWKAEMEANREDWERRTAALPDWIKPRLQTFVERGGQHFAIMGWGYELVVAELAALYAEHGVPAADEPDPDPIRAYADGEGTTGKQHAFARALTMEHAEHPERSTAGKRGSRTGSGPFPIRTLSRPPMHVPAPRTESAGTPLFRHELLPGRTAAAMGTSPHSRPRSGSPRSGRSGQVDPVRRAARAGSTDPRRRPGGGSGARGSTP
jgi:hypothetical protein